MGTSIDNLDTDLDVHLTEGDDQQIAHVPSGRPETDEAVEQLEELGYEEYTRNAKYVLLRKRLPPFPEATESAFELAMSRGIDLWDVEGTGKNGRIVKRDVKNHNPD